MGKLVVVGSLEIWEVQGRIDDIGSWLSLVAFNLRYQRFISSLHAYEILRVEERVFLIAIFFEIFLMFIIDIFRKHQILCLMCWFISKSFENIKIFIDIDAYGLHRCILTLWLTNFSRCSTKTRINTLPFFSFKTSNSSLKLPYSVSSSLI